MAGENGRGSNRLWAFIKRPERAANFANFFAVASALVAAMIGIGPQILVEPERTEAKIKVSELAEINSRIETAHRDIAKLRQGQEALLRQPSSDPAAVQLRLVNERLQTVEQRQVRIERAILNDPAKALEVPLLRRDIESVREANTQSLAAVRQSVDQVYDLSKWLLGALVIGILSLAISNFLTKKSDS